MVNDIRAVIYTRVSSRKQVEQGHGCESQESACRNYAKSLGWTVLGVFHEEAISGASDNRPALNKMLSFIKKLEGEKVVLMDDVSRLARDHIKYGLFKKRIEEVGAKTAFVTMKFDETPEGNYVETIIAATAELERKQNARRTKSRMTARAKAGYYVSRAPYGYEYINDKIEGKVLVHQKPEAKFIKNALEGYASGHLETQFDVQDYLYQNLGKRYCYNSIVGLLTRKFYTGIIDMPSLGVYTNGKHKPLITEVVFQKIQQRLTQKRVVLRTERLADFPLKSSIVCSVCGNRYTGSVSKGRSKYYAYYHCANKSCSDRGKTTAKKLLENQFLDLLEESKIRPETFDIMLAMMNDLKDDFAKKWKESAYHKRQEVNRLNKQIEGCIDKLLAFNEPSLESRVRSRITNLEQRKLSLEKSLKAPDTFEQSFRTALEDCKKYVQNPKEQWLQANDKDKRMLPKLFFEGHLVYTRNEGFRTAPKSPPLRALRGIEKGDLTMVGLSEIVLNQN